MGSVFRTVLAFGVASVPNQNLKQFFAHKGKLLMYHGWADPNISPLATIPYYKSVVDTMGR